MPCLSPSALTSMVSRVLQMRRVFRATINAQRPTLLMMLINLSLWPLTLIVRILRLIVRRRWVRLPLVLSGIVAALLVASLRRCALLALVQVLSRDLVRSGVHLRFTLTEGIRAVRSVNSRWCLERSRRGIVTAANGIARRLFAGLCVAHVSSAGRVQVRRFTSALPSAWNSCKTRKAVVFCAMSALVRLPTLHRELSAGDLVDQLALLARVELLEADFELFQLGQILDQLDGWLGVLNRELLEIM